MAVELTDDRYPDHPMYLSNLGGVQQTRFGRLGDMSDLENAISNKIGCIHSPLVHVTSAELP